MISVVKSKREALLQAHEIHTQPHSAQFAAKNAHIALVATPSDIPSTDMLAPFVELLRLYYSGAFSVQMPFAWSRFEMFAEEPLAEQDKIIMHAIKQITHPSEEDARNFPFDFNRLFVGPGRLLAAPYETLYVAQGRALMQQDTLAVRASYRHAGFEPRALNNQPDDHLAYELAFLGELLEMNNVYSLVLFRKFMQEHLGYWYVQHAEEVRANAQTVTCRAFADLLERVCSWCICL